MILTRPLVFLDTETTGTDIQTDKIIEFAMIKIHPDGRREQGSFLINPEREIPAGATEIHGKKNDDVKDAKPFRNYAKAINERLHSCDFGGANIANFDIPLIAREMEEAGIIGFPDWDFNIVDPQDLHRKLNPQTLSDLYLLYTGTKLEGAHGALTDTQAAEIVLAHILEKHFKPETTPEELDNFCQGEKRRYDIAGKLYKNSEGVVFWNFTNKKDKPVLDDPGAIVWALKQTFVPEQTKKLLRELISTPN